MSYTHVRDTGLSKQTRRVTRPEHGKELASGALSRNDLGRTAEQGGKIDKAAEGIANVMIIRSGKPVKPVTLGTNVVGSDRLMTC